MKTYAHLWYISFISSYNEKRFRQKLYRKSRHMLYVSFFLKSCLLWDNVEKYCTAGQDTYDNKKRRMRITCCITKATNTHSQYVIIIAFPLQQWLHERTSILRYTHIALLRFTLKYLDPLETNGKYLTPCYTIQSSTFCPRTRYCMFLRFAQQSAIWTDWILQWNQKRSL